MAQHVGLCADAPLGCPCRGDATIHQDRSRELSEARAAGSAAVECPECGEATTAVSIAAWGNCRACRTAHSRSTHPLRW
ncbi:hypothetical protein DQ244_13015 [Blastococcus sp. TBT05-19]|uniref:hypothetical protein n=1 Tax=Blastococcus sp. TBT05-19 TaxID=2250581 RepID=UPI000DEAEF40|nr:hypothetical protein [Blastococcus sp. TBT05-19]RBY90361.1 hypothetical protein DQ244_13015 [Blastococcus sp. TBT05-19]